MIESGYEKAWAAFTALGFHEDAAALELLTSYARSRDNCFRAAAAKAIIHHRSARSAVPVLRELLRDPDQMVVRTACKSLVQLGDSRSRSRIIELVKHPDPDTRTTALQALCDMRWGEADWRDEAYATVLDRFDREANEEVRRQAAWTLWAGVNSTTWLELFHRLRSDHPPRHRTWACELAAEHGARSCACYLQDLCLDTDGHVRKAGRRALEQLNRIT